MEVVPAEEIKFFGNLIIDVSFEWPIVVYTLYLLQLINAMSVKRVFDIDLIVICML